MTVIIDCKDPIVYSLYKKFYDSNISFFQDPINIPYNEMDPSDWDIIRSRLIKENRCIRTLTLSNGTTIVSFPKGQSNFWFVNKFRIWKSKRYEKKWLQLAK